MKRALCLCAALLLAMAAFAAAEPVLPPDALRTRREPWPPVAA